MKKFLLISLLLGSIILAGCGQQQLSQNELFEKKQECNKYQDIADNFLHLKYPETDWVYVKYEILDVFFSKTLNTCLYWFKAFDRLCGINYWCEYASDYDTYIDFWIYDVLSRKEVFYKRTDSWKWVINTENEFNKEIQTLKQD